MNIKKRITIMPVFAIIGTLLLMFGVNHINSMLEENVVYPSIDNALLTSQKLALKSQVEIMVSTINEALKGVSDKSEIIRIIKQETGPVRFYDDKSGYFFTYNTKGIRISVPTKPKDDGKNFWNLKDVKGNMIVQNIVESSLNGDGFTTYYFEKFENGVSKGVKPKLSYSALIPKTDIVIGTGLYIDNIEKEVNKIKNSLIKDEKIYTNYIILAVLLYIVLAGSISVILTKQIINPVSLIADSLKKSADHVSGASGQVAQTSQVLASGANEQAASIEEISSSLQEISSTTKKNADNTIEANNMVNNVSTEASQGYEAMKKMQDAISGIKTSSDETAKILKTIDEIAFQTNLLALNAAVEAARAGEAGKGFAVVAEEVRSLAQRSADAARNTASLISDSQKNAENGVTVMTSVTESFQKIVKGIKDVNVIIEEVSQSSTNQATGIEQINEGINQMNHATQSNASVAEESTSASEELSAQASEMKRIVDHLSQLAGIENLENM